MTKNDPEIVVAEVTTSAKKKKHDAPASMEVADSPKPKPLTREPQKAGYYLKRLGKPPELPARSPQKEDRRAGKQLQQDQPEPRVTARQFVRARGHRWDMSAGFLNEMKREMGQGALLQLHEWAPLWEAFWTRPVGSGRR